VGSAAGAAASSTGLAGTAALEAEHKPDAILTFIKATGIRGVALIKTIREYLKC